MNVKSILFVCIAVIYLQSTHAQVAINTTSLPAHSSAALDITSVEKGLLLPRMTTAQRLNIQNPATSLIVFDTDLGNLFMFDGTIWTEIIIDQIWSQQSDKVYAPLEANVGIGTNSPQFPLEIRKTYTGSSTWRPAFRTHYTLNTSNGGPNYAIGSELSVEGSHNYGGDFGQAAGYFVAYGDTPSGYTIDKITGLHARVYNDMSNANWVSGVSTYIEKLGSGLIQNAAGFIVNSMWANTGTNPIVNSYGLYVNPLALGNNRWGIYVNSTDNNYLGGRLGIGEKSPARALHVNDVMRLQPRDTPPSNPSKGDMYMDNLTNKLRVYDGTTWQDCW